MPRAVKLPQSLKNISPQELFPAVYARDPHHRGWARGGYSAALEQLSTLEPEQYGRERGYPDRYSTRLSAYLRHGILSLAQARDHGLSLVPASAPSKAWKYVNELSWRDYFVRVYAEVGDLIWQDFQPYKTGLRADEYRYDFPDDIDQSTTGLVCIDSWSRDLRETGYLHNHVRMWFSSYIIHHRRVWWQGGARWFMTHLLDGDPAANNLNWQWVASTFRAYPYLWNRANLQKYVGDKYCAPCPLREAGCPFHGTYAALSARLFPEKRAAEGETGHLEPANLKGVPWQGPPTPQKAPEGDVVVWVHGDRLSPLNEALSAYPGRPSVFVWDDELLKRWVISAKRLTFLHESVAELPVHVLRGVVADEVARFAQAHGARTVATTPSPRPLFAQIVQRLQEVGFTVQIWPEPVFAESVSALDLRSHTSYWHQIKASAFGRAPALPETGKGTRKPKGKKTTP